MKKISLFFALLIVIAHLMFGSIHAYVSYAVQGSFTLLFLLYCLTAMHRESDTSEFNRSASIMIGSLVVFMIFLIIQSFLLDDISSSSTTAPQSLSNTLTCMLVFILSYQIMRDVGFQRYNLFVLSIGTTLSLIALSHWFADNGKLFWIFEAEMLERTSRARWPFVNPNHLAASLLLPLALGISLFSTAIEEFLHTYEKHKKSRNFSISHFLSTKTGQQPLISVFVYGVISLLILLTLLASQSRNGFINLLILIAVGSFIQIQTPRAKKKKRKRKEEILDTYELEQRKRVADSSKRKIPTTLLLPAFFAATLCIVLLLSPQGSELLDQRLQQGITQSKEDIRATLYTDSLPMISWSPIFGLGSAEWAKRYPEVQSREIYPYQPRYLHSDPLQFVIEYGFVGLAIILIGLLLLIKALLKDYSSLYQAKRRYFLFHALGLLLIGIFSFFDFPYHIPAIRMAFFTYFGALCAFPITQREAISKESESNMVSTSR